jgi:nucleotide-binding universal stress UspA family protein
MFRNVLVVVDSTIDSREAVRQAVDLAQRERSRLTLITVEQRLPACAYFGAAAALPLVVPAAEADARKVMCDALAEVPRDVPVTTVLATPPVRKALLSQIVEGGHDLVVIGARPGRPARWAVLGITHYLVRRSPAPVLAVQAPGRTESAAARATRARTRRRRWPTRSPAT